ncbi:MAG: hypothetical protein NT024_07130, partial [Proteobacteria bacterium]|nr:hypothetical protein [Pseudomonadota bacterium]
DQKPRSTMPREQSRSVFMTAQRRRQSATANVDPFESVALKRLGKAGYLERGSVEQLGHRLPRYVMATMSKHPNRTNDYVLGPLTLVRRIDAQGTHETVHRVCVGSVTARANDCSSCVG